eukprot:2543572-Lingulodinium_polyedra.AAC.1
MAPWTRAAATGARLAGPACAATPRSLNVVDAGTPPPSAASHRRRLAVLVHSRLFAAFSCQSTAASRRL